MKVLVRSPLGIIAIVIALLAILAYIPMWTTYLAAANGNEAAEKIVELLESLDVSKNPETQQVIQERLKDPEWFPKEGSEWFDGWLSEIRSADLDIGYDQHWVDLEEDRDIYWESMFGEDPDVEIFIYYPGEAFVFYRETSKDGDFEVHLTSVGHSRERHSDEGLTARDCFKQYGSKILMYRKGVGWKNDRFARLCEMFDEGKGKLRRYVQVLEKLRDGEYLEITAFEMYPHRTISNFIQSNIGKGFTRFTGKIP